VVTNAHVVAGEANTEVQVEGLGPGLPARVIVFDPRDDIALLRVTGLSQPPLMLAPDPRSGTPAAILGYPLDGSFDAEPGRIGQSNVVRTQNAYGVGPVVRTITPLRGRVRPGNSGGPMVDANGRVVTTVFAALTGTTRPGGFGVPNSLVRAELQRARGRVRGVGTGRCAG
jgi:S1-C subfamily serine protease